MSTDDAAKANYEAYLKLAMHVRDEMQMVTTASLLGDAWQAYEADQVQRVAEARMTLHMVWTDLLENGDMAGHG